MNSQTQSSAPTLAIVGMAAHAAGCRSLDDLARCLYDGALPEGTPAATPAPLPEVLAAALHDAAGSVGGVALLLPGAAEVPPAVGRFAEQHNLASVQAVPGGTAHALREAQRLLAANEADAVLLGANSEAASSPAAAEPTLSYSRNAAALPQQAGAAALLLMRAEHARQRRYALLKGLALAEAPGAPTAQAVAQAAQQALAAAGVDVGAVGYLELHASGSAAEDAAELGGLLQTYRAEPPAPTCAIGSLKAVAGNTPGAAGLLALVRAALCLEQRYIPVVPRWAGPVEPQRWQQSPFYAAAESRPWLIARGQQRVAALSLLEAGNAAHLVLAEDTARPARQHGYVQATPPFLYPLAGDTQDEIISQLATLEGWLAEGSTPAAAAQRCYAAWSQREPGRYALALVAHDATELRRDIERAREGVAQAFATNGEWKTPGGSYFTAQPLGPRGKVAFVYPGAFTAYIGLGRTLFQLFPALYSRFAERTADIGHTLGAWQLYPRSLEPLSDAQLREREARMVDDPMTMLEIGTGFSMLYTLLLRDLFGMQPAQALGYSQGETTMMHALGAWNASDEASRALRDSTLYRTRLSGPRQAVREYWGASGAHLPDSELWANYILMVAPDKVAPLLHDEPHAYLAVVNSPREVMLAGEQAACQRVMAQVKGRSLQTPFSHVIHSPPVQSEYDEFVRLNRLPVHDVPGVCFYSAAEYGPLKLDSDTIAHSVARVYCQPLDFPRLVQRVYDEGGRIFVELGPARNCSHWIDSILKGQDFTAMSINKKGAPDQASLLRVLAQLLSHRVPLNLAPLYTMAAPATPPLPAAPPEVPAGGTHAEFLAARRAALHTLEHDIQQYMQQLRQAASAPAPASALPPEPPPARDVVFDEQQLRSFTVGSVVECFGPEYQIFEDRRIPRTPNGDLQMMSRVTEIQGRRGEFAPDTLLVSEYDIPADAWYLCDNSYPVVPYAVWMEIALQPCGFLSAYLGSLLLFPGADLYFRNLDGYGCLEQPQPDLRGETVVTRARLRSSTFIQDIIIQKYAFEVQHQGATLYEGEAVFGYFTPEALYNQIGLDASKTSQPWYVRQGQHARLQTFDLRDPATRQQFLPAAQRPHEGLAHGQLDLLDEVSIIEDGGEHGQGYVFARRRVDPEAWFFACHFFQDPVMPGSLGVEGMLQAMQVYALRRGLTQQFASPHFEHLPKQTVSWRYRGQIVREVPEWSLEVQFSRVEVRPDEVVLVGDASLWRGDLRIYEVRGLALRIAETVEDARQTQMQTARGTGEIV